MNNSEASPIDFYFDFSSPYGYFAAARIDQVVAPFDRTVTWHPILLGPALDKTGNIPLINQPVKNDYTEYDCARLARFMTLPWCLNGELPDGFPMSTVKTARTFYAIEQSCGDQNLAKEFAMLAYKAFFGDGSNINTHDVISGLLDQLDVDTDEIMSAINDPSIKERLRNEVETSLDKGVFGSPFVILDGEKFWGSDRFWMIKRWLKSGGW